MAKQKEKYNKESMADSIKYYLDNTGHFLTQEAVTTESGFKIPEPIRKATAERIADHILNDIQLALLSGKSVYFPEIGFIELKTLKAGRRFNNIATKEVSVTTQPTRKIKVRTSKELLSKLNPSDEKE